MVRDCERDAQIVRMLLKHESDAISQRLGWMATLQGLLFTGLGFAWDKAQSGDLVMVLSLLGCTISLIVALALYIASRATQNILIWWEDHCSASDGPPVIGFAPRDARSWKLLFPVWNFLPLLFIAAWLWILSIKR